MKATFRKIYPDSSGRIPSSIRVFHKEDFSNVRDHKGITINRKAFYSPEQVLDRERLVKLQNDIHRQHEKD